MFSSSNDRLDRDSTRANNRHSKSTKGLVESHTDGIITQSSSTTAQQPINYNQLVKRQLLVLTHGR